MYKIYSDIREICIKYRFFIIILFIIILLFNISNLDSFTINENIDLSKKKDLKTIKIRDLTNAILKNPDNPIFFLERALYNINRNDFKAALIDLEKCVYLDSSNFDYQYKIAEVYFESSKLEGANPNYPILARKHLLKALELNKSDYRSHALFGELLLAYKQYKKALKHLNMSLEINYNQPKTHLLLGYTFKQINQFEQAINCFRNAVNIDPDFIEGYIQLGQIYHVRKDTLAIIYYDNALELDGNDEIVLYNKAVFFQEIMDWNKALLAYTDLHKINPFHANGHYNIGFIHMELGLYDIAVNNFSDAIYSESTFHEAYYSRGVCFETLGNIAQAESDYNRSIEINPEYSYGIDALKELQNKNKKYQ